MSAHVINRGILILLTVLVALAGLIVLMQYQTRDVSGAVIGNPNTAAYYIKFDGIDGEARERDHAAWIDLASFGQALRTTSGGLTGDGSTRRRGDVIVEDIVLTKEVDKSSPKLLEAVATGAIFPTVQIHVTTSYAEVGRVTYFAYELKNVLVTSYSVSGSGSVDDVPTEQVTLNFEEIKVTYTENDSAGRTKGNVEYTWNVEAGIS